jgi:hypothetical protein
MQTDIDLMKSEKTNCERFKYVQCTLKRALTLRTS